MVGEKLLKRRLDKWHGVPDAAYQYAYYRCLGCRALVTWAAIKKGGCYCGESNRLAPARLTRWEMIRLTLFPWWGVTR